MKPPLVFISYRWESDDHKSWVRELARRLRSDGVDAILDQWETAPGDQLTEFMERSVRESDYVLVICTPGYKMRSDGREGGVGYEGDIMTAEVFAGNSRRKFIPILRGKDWSNSSPSWLLGSYYIDFSNDPYSETSYENLLSTLHGRTETAPPIGRLRQDSNDDHGLVRNRIDTSFDSAEWPGAWKALFDRDPYDDYLHYLGIRWLMDHDRAEQWAMVWLTLVAFDPHDHYLSEIGLKWLEQRPRRSRWIEVWRRLMELRPHDDYLVYMGLRWLEDHA